ncbi:ACP S-malonyltransferase [Nocardiopsis chromatogenes]|uniref:ACP S-malonyltransferase n=1 Tax=Nocardiopsis chromatogenes TaxID=280239 RepID=UPI000348B034|nr:ACP S-malonyltransferase [Nocardiopsis chromatogenes]
MAHGRALVLPGLVPLAPGNLAAILGVEDAHLELAAEVCGFDPARVRADDPSRLPTTVHEALLTVAVVRRMEEEGGGWDAVGGLSAGCLPALLAAGAIGERTCLRLAHEINTLQAARTGLRRTGTTVAVLAPSEADAVHLMRLLAEEGHDPWWSIDLGGGVVGIAVPAHDPEPLAERLRRLGVMVLDTADRAEHCPYAAPTRDEFAGILADAPIGPARVPVVSPLTGKAVDRGPEALRAMLVEQWFDTASLPRLVDGLLGAEGVHAVDLVSPARSVYVARMRDLVRGRGGHRLLALPG